MNSVDTINLPDYIWWEDETDWTPVEQSVEYSTTGALLVDLAVKLAGQPLTLVGDESTAWVTREAVLGLQAFAAVPGKEMTVAIHGRSFQAMFRHDGGKPVDAEPVVRITPPADDDWYVLKALRFLILSENL